MAQGAHISARVIILYTYSSMHNGLLFSLSLNTFWTLADEIFVIKHKHALEKHDRQTIAVVK